MPRRLGWSRSRMALPDSTESCGRGSCPGMYPPSRNRTRASLGFLRALRGMSHMSRKRKVNSVLKNFIAHSRELRVSPAWRALPDNARRVLDRLELEHMQHAGERNGTLVCTFDDFAKNGIRRRSVSLAIRQSEVLGFLETTRKGGLGKGKTHLPSQYRLTYV